MSKKNITKAIATEAAIEEAILNTAPATIPTAPAIHDHIDEILAELHEQNTTAAPVKAKKAKADKRDKPAKETVKFDLDVILNNLPEEFTPAILDKAFALNDGGKTVRRHLRNHFAEAMTHNKKDKWTFSREASTDIITYFASRYPFHAEALTVTKEVQA